MDGEYLDDWEHLEITVDFLRFKNTETLENIKELIPKNLVDSQNRTLLHWAALKNQLAKARFLMENDLIDPAIKDSTGYNSLELACKKSNKFVRDYLKKIGLTCSLPPENKLNSEVDLEIEGRMTGCIYADNSEELSLLLPYVTNKNGFFTLCEFYEWTLLTLCGYFLAPKCMKFLIDFGCSANGLDGDEASPLENVINSIVSVLPPENEEEYVEFNAGIDCLTMLLDKVRNVKEYMPRIKHIFNKTVLVGKGSSAPTSEYEQSIEKKTYALRLAISRIINDI